MLKKFIKRNVSDEPHHAIGKGKLLSLESLNNDIFKSKIMGEGYAIELTEGTLIAPISGVITSIHPMGHSLQIMENNGTEYLIYLGLEVAKLKGEGVELKVKIGDKVNQDDELVILDLNQLKENNITPIVVVSFLNGKHITLLEENIEIESKTMKFYIES